MQKRFPSILEGRFVAVGFGRMAEASVGSYVQNRFYCCLKLAQETLQKCLLLGTGVAGVSACWIESSELEECTPNQTSHIVAHLQPGLTADRAFPIFQCITNPMSGLEFMV